ncbi:hypothetical protein [Actinomadura vinacea]
MNPDDSAQGDLFAEIQAVLARVNAAVDAGKVPEELVGVLVATGECERAEAIADRAGTWRNLITQLWRHGERERARRVLARRAGAYQVQGPRSSLSRLVQDLLSVGAADEARGVVDDRVDELDRWARTEIAAEFVRRGRPGDGLEILDGREDETGEVVLALIEAGRLRDAEETARRIASEDRAPFGRFALAFAEHGRPETAERFALLAAAVPVRDHLSWPELSTCAALTRVGRLATAVTRFDGLSDLRRHANFRPMSDAHGWARVPWGEYSGWALGSPRRYAAAAMAEQAVRAGAEDRLLEEAARRDDDRPADLLRAAVAITHAQAGDDRGARRHLAGVTSVEGRVEGRLALAEALAATSPAVAAEAAVQALELVEQAAATASSDSRQKRYNQPFEWDHIRMRVREEVAVLLARAGRQDEAMRVADGIPTGHLTSASAFRRIAEALGRPVGEPPTSLLASLPGSPKGAEEAVDAVVGGSRRPSDELVDAVLRDREALISLLPSFDALDDRHVALTRVAQTLLEEGDAQAARRVAVHAVSRTPPGPPNMRAVLTGPAAVRLAKDGDLDRAVALAGGRSRVLVDMIVALLDEGSVDAARRVLAEAADGAPVARELAGRLEREGLVEHLPLAGFPAADPREDVGAGERLAAELLSAPDGLDLDTVDRFGERIAGIDRRVLIGRLIRAARYRTAWNVANAPDHGFGWEDHVPSSLRATWRIGVAAAAHERAPALSAWALEIAELTYREARAEDAAVLAEIAAFPGWPADRALALFRTALARTERAECRTHARILAVLEKSIPLLARHDGGRPLRDLIAALA